MSRLAVAPLALIVALAAALSAAPASAQTRGVAHTPQVDIGYETYGVQGATLPVIAVNGGPGLSHAYMLVNDL